MVRVEKEENEISAAWKVYKSEQKERRNHRRDKRIEELERFCKVFGASMKKLTDYQVRITYGTKIVDVFITHNKYHDVVKNKRGNIKPNLTTFLTKYLSK